MTREEAIEYLNTLYMALAVFPNQQISLGDIDKLKESVYLAIHALEQETVLDKVKTEIKDTLYVDSLIFGELIDFKNGKMDVDDVIEEFNRVTRSEVLQIIDKYRAEGEVDG